MFLTFVLIVSSLRMVELAKKYPYFNEDAEINWRQGNPNMEMAQDMAKITHFNFQVQKVDQYRVHDINFKPQEGTSLPVVDCDCFLHSLHSTAKER